MKPDLKILLISYYFPPLGGAGIGRPLSLFKYLPDNGVKCHVLTVKPITYRVYEPNLIDDLDQSNIYRSGSYDPQRLMYLAGLRKISDRSADSSRKISTHYFPDSKTGWVGKAVKLGRVLLENKNYSAIISSSPPMSAHLVGRKLHQEFKIPWLADFRDVWTSLKPEDWYSDQKDIDRAKKLLNQIRDDANAVTVVNQSIADYLGRGDVIANSFDSRLAQHWQRAERNGKFYIGLLGTIDNLTPVKPLFELLDSFRKSNNDLFEKIRICQVGRINDNSFQALIDKYEFNNKIEINGFCERVKTIELMNKVYAFYLGINKTIGNHLTTGRIFDMIASGRPILLSASPDSEAAQLVKRHQCGINFDEHNFEPAINYLSSKMSSDQAIIPLPDYAREHSSDFMVNKFVEKLNSIKGKS